MTHAEDDSPSQENRIYPEKYMGCEGQIKYLRGPVQRWVTEWRHQKEAQEKKELAKPMQAWPIGSNPL